MQFIIMLKAIKPTPNRKIFAHAPRNFELISRGIPVPYSIHSVGAAEAIYWQGFYWVVCHYLPSVISPCSILLNAERQARKWHAPFK